MSKSTFFAGAAIATLMTTAAYAITPASRDTGNINFALPAENLNDFHMALYAGSFTRNVQSDFGTAEIDLKRYNAILGYDLNRWLTVYALSGIVDAKESASRMDSESAMIWGVGVWANLIESEQLPLLTTVSSYRVSAGTEFSYADTDSFSWSQFDSFLTFEIVNELNDSQLIFPRNIGLFFGPIASYIVSDEYDSDSDNVFGLTVGVDLMFTKNTYATIAGDFYSDDEGVYGMVGVRF